MLEFISEPLDKVEIISHGYFTRHGGISEGIYSSLNCGFGSKDNKEHVRENRNRVMQNIGLSIGSLRTTYQTHSANVVVIKDINLNTSKIMADAMVCNIKGITLGVLTADCAPVLLVDPINDVIGAVHAGWKGAVSGIIEATISEMSKLGAEAKQILATVGPCIGKNSYEVGPDFISNFEKQDIANRCFFSKGKRGDRLQFDLNSYLLSRLSFAGVTKSNSLWKDTYSDDSLFSYRRSCLKGESDYGRNISVISLK